MASSASEKLPLDPGTVTRRRTSGCKCLLYTCGITGVILSTIFFARIVSRLFYGARSPHPWLYENKTLGEVEDLSTIVRPLVDESQKFDIFATVWIKDPGPRSNISHQEHPIFSDVVFRGVTLMDEHIHTKVNLSIPLETFKAIDLENYDLRAAFTLVPQSPSLLDYMTNFTTWLPLSMSSAKIHPNKEFLEGKEAFKNTAIESFGITTPLIEFHSIQSACSAKPSNPDGAQDKDSAADRMFDIKSTKGKSPLHRHPYIVTRSDLRVVRMTRLYNRRAYDLHHHKLQRNDSGTTGCYWSADNEVKDPRRCIRSFMLRANAEMRIELEVPDEKTGEKKKQIAYAPFLHANGNSWGPLDLVQIPVNRENCTDSTMDSQSGPEASGTPDVLNVIWNVAYSGTTPEKLLLSQFLGIKPRFNASDTEFNKIEAQRKAATTQRIHGHKHSHDAHLGRLFILGFIAPVLAFIRINLNIHYWFTRSSSAGISILGSSLMAASLLIYLCVDLWAVNEDFGKPDESIFTSMISLILTLYANLAIALVVLRAVLRLDFVDGFPYMKAMPASHLERASSRLETRGRMRLLLAIFVGAVVFSFVKPLHDFHLVARVGPKPDLPTNVNVVTDWIFLHITMPLTVAGAIYQLMLNTRSKTFAGQYSLTALVEAVERLVNLGSYVPWIAGKVYLRNEFSVLDLVPLLISFTWVVQAMLYPRVPQDADDKDNN